MANDQYLYKFMPFNKNALLTILRNELYFANPDKLNDPIDCLHNVKLKNPLQLREDVIIPLIHKYRSLITWNWNKKSDDQIAKDYLENEELLPKLLIHLIRLKTKDRIGVYSFSEIFNEQRLWSHYADSAKGICLVFDKKMLINKIEPFTKRQDYQLRTFYYSKVNYGNQPFEIEIKDDDIQFSEGYYFNKKIVWKYEKEYRIILSANEGFINYATYEKNRYYSFPKEALKGVILGEKTTTYELDTIICLRKSIDYNFMIRKVIRDIITCEIKFIKPGN